LAGRRCAYAKPADKNVMHTQKDFDRDVYKNPYLKVAGITTKGSGDSDTQIFLMCLKIALIQKRKNFGHLGG
jgi:hypothetical protein